MANAGRRRLEAWIYDVVNPMLQGLEHPISLLKQQTWSWRFFRRRLEWIRPASEIIEQESGPNLEDLVESNPAEGSAFRLWAQGIQKLETACSTEFDCVRQHGRFLEVVATCIQEFQPTRLGGPWGGWPDEKAPDILAEHIVNNRTDLESDNSTREFWEQFRADLEESVRGDVVWVNLHRETGEAGANLLVLGKGLDAGLKAFRRKTCTDHDIPFAPTQYR